MDFDFDVDDFVVCIDMWMYIDMGIVIYNYIHFLHANRSLSWAITTRGPSLVAVHSGITRRRPLQRPACSPSSLLRLTVSRWRSSFSSSDLRRGDWAVLLG